MSSDSPVIQAAKVYLASFLRGKTFASESKHPWRKSWEFFYHHSLRVDAICQKLLAGEAPDLPARDAFALRLAAILHDIARLDDRADHARLGARMVEAWLQTQPVDCSAQVVDLIAHHSEKDLPGPTLSHALLKDADLLDEIGVISVFMASNWVDSTSPFFFYDLAERLERYEIPYCQKTSARLQTASARAYLDQKKQFIESVIAEFTFELEGVPREVEERHGERETRRRGDAVTR